MASSGFDLVRKRWSVEILLELRGETKRYNFLLTHIPGISDRVLTQRLVELVDNGYVVRDVEAGPPVRVYYSLTKKATPFIQPLAELVAL